MFFVCLGDFSRLVHFPVSYLFYSLIDCDVQPCLVHCVFNPVFGSVQLSVIVAFTWLFCVLSTLS